jgi:signal transduction histidine kinase
MPGADGTMRPSWWRALTKRTQNSILTIHLRDDGDFLLARQRAKQIAVLVGFETQDQTRIATAVSEIARNALEYAKGGRAEYFLDSAPIPRLRIVISDQGGGIAGLESIYNGTYTSSSGMGVGISGARRLLDGFELETSGTGTVATLIKNIPPHKLPLPSLAQISAHLAQAATGSSVALRDQNQELLNLLSDLRAREVELNRLNVELEETNRGVLVLYAELEDKALAVQQASEMKTRFLSGVTHELRTPLNSIVSLSRLLIHRIDGDLNAEQEKQVGFILRSAQTLSEMVNDLLDLAKIEAGKTTLKLSEVSVQETLAALRGMFRPMATNERVALVFDLPEAEGAEMLRLRTDEGKLAQILRNFISNALKFTEAGSVTVSAKRQPGSDGEDDEIVFSVADTGIGIAPEHHQLVMQEWGQVEEALHNRHKGSGLGLPLSRSLAELMGGRVWFTSAPGEGSTFYLALPALPGSHPTIEQERAKHVLMADDDEVSRYLLRRRLSTLTMAEIEETESGPECLEAIERRPPAILFLDLVMPGMNGTEVLRRLRERAETRDLPVVILTSKILTAEERFHFDSAGVQVISKRLGDLDSDQEHQEEQQHQIERALLQVGLSNMHEGSGSL